MDMYSRTRMLIGDGVDKLKKSKVLVCGLGGVGTIPCCQVGKRNKKDDSGKRNPAD